MLETAKIREQFPFLREDIRGFQIAYLDSAATAQKPQVVIDAVADAMASCTAPVHRASYDLAARATEEYEAARRAAAKFIGAAPQEIVFTRNATAAINLVAGSLPVRHVALTEMEHHSNIVPWFLRARERGGILRWISAAETVDEKDYQAALREEPDLVALTHVSNVLGTRNPVEEMAQAARKAGALVLVDGTQAVPRIPVDVQNLGADFYVFSGHKAYGPSGIGVLWAREGLLKEPWEGGGSMISRVRHQEISWAALPHRFEPGTPPLAEAAGLRAALGWIEETGLQEIGAHERHLAKNLREGLRELGGIKVWEGDEGIVAFDVEGVHAHDTAEIINRFGVCVRAGHHCAEILVRNMGVAAVVRASFAAYSRGEEVERTLRAVKECQRIFA